MALTFVKRLIEVVAIEIILKLSSLRELGVGKSLSFIIDHMMPCGVFDVVHYFAVDLVVSNVFYPHNDVKYVLVFRVLRSLNLSHFNHYNIILAETQLCKIC